LFALRTSVDFYYYLTIPLGGFGLSIDGADKVGFPCYICLDILRVPGCQVNFELAVRLGLIRVCPQVIPKIHMAGDFWVTGLECMQVKGSFTVDFFDEETPPWDAEFAEWLIAWVTIASLWLSTARISFTSSRISTIGLAKMPGIAVLPMWWMSSH
jgi:hypothetical protein